MVGETVFSLRLVLAARLALILGLALTMSTTNITLDDTSPTIVYSSNWAAQFSSNSSSISQFFGGTYHSAQANGATANLTFNGSAIYIYGTKGPEHVCSLRLANFDD